MKKLKYTTLFLWILVLGALVCVLSITMCSNRNNRTVNNISDDEKSYYERFEEELRTNVKIIDTTESCDEALEEIYRDDENIYYLPCIKSDNITIQLLDGNRYPLMVALENEVVTIAELKALGLKMYIEPIDLEKSDVTYIEID